MPRTGFGDGIAVGPLNASVLTAGKAAQQTLRVAANVASGETVVIGGDTYRVATAATDSTKNIANGELASTSHVNNPIATISMAAHGLKQNDIIRVENEIMLVLQALGTEQILVRRGACNTAVATHADGTDIFTEAVPGAGGRPIGLNATLTPAVATDALIWAINNLGNERVVAIDVDANTVVVATADKPGGTPVPFSGTIAVSETLAGAGNAWDGATITGGLLPQQVHVEKIVPTAAEVTAGKIVKVFPFVPIVVDCLVRVTATAAAKAWDGAATVSGNAVIIDNAGATDWAATDTIMLTVRPS